MKNKQKITHIPFFLTFIPILIVSIPFIAFHFWTISIKIPSFVLSSDSIDQFALQHYVQHYVHIYILRWSVILLAAVVLLLVYIEYQLTQKKIVLSIGFLQVVEAIYFVCFPFDQSDPFSWFYGIKIALFYIPSLGLMIHSLITYRTILEKQRADHLHHEKLEYDATHDPLTGLFNRQYFSYLLDHSLKQSLEKNTHLALFLIDIDDFKPINDNYGHDQGDLFLKKFSLKLISLTRHGDIFARLGGDEFGLLTTNIHSTTTITNIAARLIAGLSGHEHSFEKENLPFTVSIGIALYPFDGATGTALLKTADLAMYKAKKAGKNAYHFFSDNYPALEKN